MHSVLFHIFNFPIHSYGFMLALSFLLGIWLSSSRAKKAGRDPNVIMDVGFYVILAAIAGARLYYVILHFEEFHNDLISIFWPFQKGSIGIGGLVMYGGFIGAILAGVIYFWRKRLPFLPYADDVAPSIGIGVCLTRIGCFLNGCCYGADAHGAKWGVVFPPDSPAGAYALDLKAKLAHDLGHAVNAVALQPSQLIESAGGLLIAALVLLAGRARLFTGAQFYLAGLLYAILRFAVDFTRYYGHNERLGMLSHNQIVCIALFIIFAGLMLKSTIFKEQETTASHQQPATPQNGGPAT